MTFRIIGRTWSACVHDQPVGARRLRGRHHRGLLGRRYRRRGRGTGLSGLPPQQGRASDIIRDVDRDDHPEGQSLQDEDPFSKTPHPVLRPDPPAVQVTAPTATAPSRPGVACVGSKALASRPVRIRAQLRVVPARPLRSRRVRSAAQVSDQTELPLGLRSRLTDPPRNWPLRVPAALA